MSNFFLAHPTVYTHTKSLQQGHLHVAATAGTGGWGVFSAPWRAYRVVVQAQSSLAQRVPWHQPVVYELLQPCTSIRVSSFFFFFSFPLVEKLLYGMFLARGISLTTPSFCVEWAGDSRMAIKQGQKNIRPFSCFSCFS